MMISVILPTYNRRATLIDSMNSVLAQSYTDLELIVVDDGSTEDVRETVCSINDPRVKYVRRPQNGGAAAARNTGLQHAQGDYIAFQDSDDLWLPGKLQKQFSLLSALPAHVGAVIGAKIVYGRDDQWNFGPGRISYAPRPESCLRMEEDQVGHLLIENRISLQNSLFRKHCFPHANWFDTCAAANEDWGFAIQLAKHTTIYEDVEPVVLGFISKDSISMQRRKEMIGLLRILRQNRDALASRKRQRSLLLLDVSRHCFLTGRKRKAIRFLIAGLQDYPSHLTLLGRTLIGSLLRSQVRNFRLGASSRNKAFASSPGDRTSLPPAISEKTL